MKIEDRFLFYITLGVLLTHLLMISWFVVFSKPLTFLKPHEKFVVKTVSVKSQTEAPVQKTQKRQEVASLENKKPQVNKAKPAEKLKPEKKSPEKEVKRELEAKKVQTQKERILEKAKENIAKLRETRDNFNAARESKSLELGDVGVIKSLSIDSHETVNSEDSGYYGTLSSRMKQALRLPEIGIVRILLTLDRQGSVVALEVVETKSEYNKKFVEATLKKVQFPPFGKCFEGEGRHTFSITLANEI